MSKNANGMVTVATVLADAERAKFEVVSTATPLPPRGNAEKVEILLLNPRNDQTSTIEASGTRGGAFIPKERAVRAFSAIL